MATSLRALALLAVLAAAPSTPAVAAEKGTAGAEKGTAGAEKGTAGAGAAKGGTPAAAKGAAAPAGEAPAKGAAAHGASAWVEHVAAEAGFAARFPGRPERSESPSGPLTVVAYAVEGEGEAPTWTVMVMSAPAEAGDLPPEMADQVGEGIALKLGPRVTRNAAVTVAGHAAREILASGEEGSVAVRLVVIGPRLYQVMAVSKRALPPADVTAFFESFRSVP